MKVTIEILQHRLTILQEGLPLMSTSFDKFYAIEDIKTYHCNSRTGEHSFKKRAA